MVRQHSSHVRLELPDGRNPVTVPVSGREVKVDTFSKILRQGGLTREQFERATEEVR